MPKYEIDKCTEVHTIRIPEITKEHLDKLPRELKAELKDKILEAMDRVIHKSMYRPGKYLKSEDI